MRISDVARQTGTPISTIRYYEKQAIIPKPHRNGRDRVFSRQDIRAIEFVRDAQSLGLPLSQISALLHGSWGTGEMAKVASSHRQTIRDRIAALTRIDAVLASLESCACTSFAQCDMTVGQCNNAAGQDGQP